MKKSIKVWIVARKSNKALGPGYVMTEGKGIVCVPTFDKEKTARMYASEYEQAIPATLTYQLPPKKKSKTTKPRA
jgi:hypothetical protein